MFQEIERKFLVEGDFCTEDTHSVEITQGYLCKDQGITVRVRIKDGRGYLTIKGKRTGISRFEWEKEITVEEAEALLAQTKSGRIEKTRYLINNSDGKYVWEVDVFHGDNEGLIIAEIELGSEDDTFDRPDWLGCEVTDNPKYYNSYLTKHPYKQWKE